MKKCPQCGTILEESKKKCYMCGAELQRSIIGFGDAFDEQVGATVTNGQDNVFNNVSSIAGGANENVTSNTNKEDVTFSNAIQSAPLVQEEVKQELPSKYDNRTAIEKIFSADSRYKSNDDFSFSSKTATDMFSSNLPSNEPKVTPVPIVPPPSPKELPKKEKPAINWGNSLDTDNAGVDESKKKLQLNFNMIFNVLSVLFFIVAAVFLYLKFVPDNDKTETNSFGGLNYQIDDDFVLQTNQSNYKYYTYGPGCAVKLTHGATVETNSFIDNYFNNVKATFEESQSITKLAEISINGNTWTEISVVDLQQNAASSSGWSEVLRYKYIVIVHKGSFYDIVFANENDGGKCQAMFEKTLKSLKLN